MQRNKASSSKYLDEPPTNLLSIATQPINFARHIFGFSESLGYADSLQTPETHVEFPSSLEYREPVETSDGEDEDEQQKKVDPETKLTIYTLDEVCRHDSFDDCWIILYDKVYDITNFLLVHPGGEDVMMEYAGRDATLAFRGVGHSRGAIKSLEEYLIGILPMSERIFSLHGWDCL